MRARGACGGAWGSKRSGPGAASTAARAIRPSSSVLGAASVGGCSSRTRTWISSRTGGGAGGGARRHPAGIGARPIEARPRRLSQRAELIEERPGELGAERVAIDRRLALVLEGGHDHVRHAAGHDRAEAAQRL